MNKLGLGFLKRRSFLVGLLTAPLVYWVMVANQKPTITISGDSATNIGTLSCGDILKVAKWSANQYGGPRKIQISSEEFSQGMTKSYLEKLDPYRVLFTAPETFKFQKQAALKWQQTVKNQDCSFYDQWLVQNLNLAKTRFINEIQSSFFLKSYISLYRFSKTAHEEKPFKKYTGFAVHENDWRTRVQDFVQVILKNSSKPLLKQYKNAMELVMDNVNQALFEEKVDSRQLLAKAVLGAFDSYSTYFSPSEFEDFYLDLSGSTSGVGIRVQKVPQGLMIDRIVSDSPASRSKKLQLGDVIVGIDGVKIGNLSMNKSKQMLKGQEGSIVKLDIKKADATETLVTIKRERFSLEDSKITHRILKSKKQSSKVAVIGVPSFYGRGGMGSGEVERSSAEDLRNVLESILDSNEEKPESIVLDLRGNPGGFLEEAVSMAGMFVGNKAVVGVMENSKTRVMRDNGFQNLYNGPLVVLVDEETASAGEVLAGALKDHKRALLVGSKSTYGKGSVQKLFQIQDQVFNLGVVNGAGNGVLKLTTSVFYTPMGHSPANGGVSTDIALTNKEAEIHMTGIQDIPPFLDGASLEELKNKQTNWAQVVEQLKQQLPEEKSYKSEEDKDLARAVDLAAGLPNEMF